jgi:hypothetical protein
MIIDDKRMTWKISHGLNGSLVDLHPLVDLEPRSGDIMQFWGSCYHRSYHATRQASTRL